MHTSSRLIRCHAKINLGLRVLGKRSDGYHDVCTVLQAIDLHDTLEVRPSRSLSLEVFPEWAGGSECDMPPGRDNLVLKAAETLKAPLGGRGAAFRLTKRIPVATGLGGASSDAAGVIVALDRLYGLGLSSTDLHRAAASIGSDVPFFLYGGACLALGRGEEVFPLPDGPRLNLVLAFPEVGLRTPEVYRAWDGLLTGLGNISRMSHFAPWYPASVGEAPSVTNDLEEAATKIRPSLREVRRALETSGASAVSMTGSGSAFFGIWSTRAGSLTGARRAHQAGYSAVTARSLSRRECERAHAPAARATPGDVWER